MEGLFILFNVSMFTRLWLSSSKDKICNILACLVKTEIKRMVLWTNLKYKSCWVNQVESIKVVTLNVCIFIYVHTKIKRKTMTTYLKLLPLLWKRNGIMWWRVDDFRWSFPFLYLGLFMSILSHMLHSFLTLQTFCFSR
jgi:hypothetical protein